MWIKNYGNLATFSCKHKVTQKPICAIPCDGVEELCENNVDEQCQGPGLLVTLLVTIGLSATFIAIASAVSFNRIKKQKTLSNTTVVQGNENINDDLSSKDNHFIYLKLSVYKTTMDIAHCIEIATLFSENDTYIMNILGTNDLTAYFYDCIERSMAVKVHIWFYNKIPKLFTAMKKLYVGAFIILIKSTVTLCLKYLDLSKDVLFLYILWLQLGQYTIRSFPMAVFYILAISLVTTEIGNFCIIILTQYSFADNWVKKMLLLLLAPFLPAYNIYVVLHYQFSKFIILNHYDLNQGCHAHMSKEIKKLDAKIWAYQLKLAKLQYNENLSENLPQLTMLLLISFLNNTSSGIVNNLQNIFIDERSFVGWVLAGMSLVSLIRGQLGYLAGIKNGCQTSTFLLASYFLFGVASR